ncbi:hypothetical protein ACOSP7_007733 [Xanthoceras sorbifolium]
MVVYEDNKETQRNVDSMPGPNLEPGPNILSVEVLGLCDANVEVLGFQGEEGGLLEGSLMEEVFQDFSPKMQSAKKWKKLARNGKKCNQQSSGTFESHPENPSC